MPVTLAADEEAAAMEKGSSELKYLFGQEQISTAMQAKFFHVGILTVQRFATLVSDKAELVEILKTEMGLDAAASLRARVEVAAFLCAHLKATTRTSETAKFEGELEARQLPKQLAVSEFLAMKAAFEQKWWKLEDVDVPSRLS